MSVHAPTRTRTPALLAGGSHAPSGRGHPGQPVPLSTHASLAAALAAAKHEILVSSTLSTPLGDPISMFRGLDHDNLRRGVRYRVLFPDRARTAPPVAARLSGLALAGAEVRTVPDGARSALVIDGKLAALPHEPGPEQAVGVAMVRLPSMVGTVVDLFERLWPAAVPFGACTVPQGAELADRERELLNLLSAGYTDESTAAQLGISVRTVRRMMADIMSRLGARSRFQAGAKAADRGWLAMAS